MHFVPEFCVVDVFSTAEHLRFVCRSQITVYLFCYRVVTTAVMVGSPTCALL